jgi:hypothetical protein
MCNFQFFHPYFIFHYIQAALFILRFRMALVLVFLIIINIVEPLISKSTTTEFKEDISFLLLIIRMDKERESIIIQGKRKNLKTSRS